VTLVSERKVKEKVRDKLKKIPGTKFIPYPQGIGGEPGTGDRIGCVLCTITADMVGETFGQFVMIEVKRPTVTDSFGKIVQRGTSATELQKLRAAEWSSVGGKCVILSDAGVAEAFVREINKTTNQSVTKQSIKKEQL
jgi:hypothetical protein